MGWVEDGLSDGGVPREEARKAVEDLCHEFWRKSLQSTPSYREWHLNGGAGSQEGNEGFRVIVKFSGSASATLEYGASDEGSLVRVVLGNPSHKPPAKLYTWLRADGISDADLIDVAMVFLGVRN